MNLKIEEIVKSLRSCSADVMDCENCVAGLFHRAWCCDTLRLYAADLIEQLQQELIDERYRHDRYADFCVAQGEELSRLKAQQRWIPVTERLPEVSTRTLVSIDDCVGVAYFIHGNSGMCFFGDYTGKPLTFVTHWMPLPEPPMEEENENAQG